MNLTSATLMGGELRYGRYGFFCSNGRKHVFHRLFSEPSGTSMDIGPCEGDACPLAQTHGPHVCQSCESCLDTRRITLDKGRELKVHFHPRGGWQGRGKNRRRACSVTIMRAGSLEPGWYHELAQQAEAADGLTAGRPHDWLERKLTRECATNENGHHWAFEDDEGTAVKHPDGRHVLHWDSDNLAADGAVQRNCSHCHETQMKRPDGRWSGDLDDCPCCAELPAEHVLYHCKRCSHGAPQALVTQQERDYFSGHDRAGTSASIIMGVPTDMRREYPAFVAVADNGIHQIDPARQSAASSSGRTAHRLECAILLGWLRRNQQALNLWSRARNAGWKSAGEARRIPPFGVPRACLSSWVDLLDAPMSEGGADRLAAEFGVAGSLQ